jgi:RND family efflux transporter MFP subunit
MKNIKYLAVILTFGIIFSGCNQKFIKKEVKKPEFAGYIENTQVNVTTRIPGRLTAIYVDEGDTLKKGEPVAQLDNRELVNNINALKTKLANVAVNKKRVENLYKAGAVPLKKLNDIETGYAMLVDKIAALNTRLEDMTIRAPMDGVVTVKVLEVNQMMPPGMPVVIETDPQGTWARFNIPESYLGQIRLGKIFTLKSNIPGVTFKAKVIQLLPMADFATYTPTEYRDQHDIRTFDVKMKIISNLQQCKPGLSVFLTLKPLETAENHKK